jgi:CBS-domain-containing membrane protein
MNRLKPLILGHLLSCLIGFVASLMLPVPYISAAVSITVSVIAMTLLRIAYPPAVSTSLIFSYRPHEVSSLLTFLLTLLVVAVLAFLYFVLIHGIRPSRFAGLFGLLHEQDSRPVEAGGERSPPGPGQCS